MIPLLCLARIIAYDQLYLNQFFSHNISHEVGKKACVLHVTNWSCFVQLVAGGGHFYGVFT